MSPSGSLLHDAGDEAPPRPTSLGSGQHQVRVESWGGAGGGATEFLSPSSSPPPPGTHPLAAPPPVTPTTTAPPPVKPPLVAPPPVTPTTTAPPPVTPPLAAPPPVTPPLAAPSHLPHVTPSVIELHAISILSTSSAPRGGAKAPGRHSARAGALNVVAGAPAKTVE